MKRPTPASLKKVTPENLARLGAERLAEILCAAAETKPELKRRLRMELAAEQGAEHLVVEIDKRLASLATSRSKVSWRQRPTFVRDLDALRRLIADRLAGLERETALDRLWSFMDVARRVGGRVRDKHGELAAVFDRAAHDIAAFLPGAETHRAAEQLGQAVAANPYGWSDWLPIVVAGADTTLAAAALTRIQAAAGTGPAIAPAVRKLADAAGDVDAFRATFTDQALRTPSVAAEIAGRLMEAGRMDEAGTLLRAVAPKLEARGVLGDRARAPEVDFDWESAWIDYLERSGDGDGAQAVRWASFERTLSIERARAFTSRLGEFDDVEAEGRAFEHAARHSDVERALRFLMDWPALPEAARMILARADEIEVRADEAELWAGRLRGRFAEAALRLLRRAATTALRRRDFATAERLTQEADAIGG